MIRVVTALRMATAPIAIRIAALPNHPITAVATGGPATQAKENTARVLTTSRGPAPVCRRCANSSELPTPAGPPRTTSATVAIGRLVANRSATARARVNTAAASEGSR
jgi:hypothetical protein